MVSRTRDCGMALNAVKYVKSLKTCRPVKKKKMLYQILKFYAVYNNYCYCVCLTTSVLVSPRLYSDRNYKRKIQHIMHANKSAAEESVSEVKRLKFNSMNMLHSCRTNYNFQLFKSEKIKNCKCCRCKISYLLFE